LQTLLKKSLRNLQN